MATAAPAGAAKTPAQTFALVFGAVYVLVGILGFIMDPILGIFEVNLLHNIAHLLVGGLFLFGSKSAAGAKQISLIIGVVYGLLAILGFLGGIVVEDLLDANMADHFLHLATAVVALYFGLSGGSAATTSTAA